MAANKLPDELIKEILVPVLQVPDEQFFDYKVPSAFVWVQSSSPPLAVCKRWLRVATPLLYNVVIIRSKAQAQALQRVLATNPALGQYIKKIRIEAGFCPALGKIISSAPNITDLFISTAVRCSDNVSNVCRALPTINPTSLSLYDPKGSRWTRNAQFRQLKSTLVDCIRVWSNLRIFQDSRSTEPDIITAVSMAPHLEVVRTPQAGYVGPLVQSIAQKQSLKRIELLSPLGLGFKQLLQSNARLRSLVKPIAESEARPVVTFEIPDDPTFTPMLGVPEDMQDKIWKRILTYAMNLDGIRYPWTRRTRLSLILVSRQFHRLGIPLLYSNPLIDTQRDLIEFACCLQVHSDLGLYLRRLRLSESVITSATLPDLHTVLSKVPGLCHLTGSFYTTIDWESFTTLAQVSGPSLVSLQFVNIAYPGVEQSPDIFSFLVNLRSLSWRSDVAFSKHRCKIRDALRNLEELRIDGCDPSFFCILTQMRLPVLRRLELSLRSRYPEASKFLQHHGRSISQLKTVDVDWLSMGLLSSLTELELMACENALNFSNVVQHHSLKKIVIGNVFSPDDQLPLLFNTFDPRKFPALREVQVHRDIWPLTEHDIRKSPWPAHSESLLAHNVRLTDVAGRAWKTRLKS